MIIVWTDSGIFMNTFTWLIYSVDINSLSNLAVRDQSKPDLHVWGFRFICSNAIPIIHSNAIANELGLGDTKTCWYGITADMQEVVCRGRAVCEGGGVECFVILPLKGIYHRMGTQYFPQMCHLVWFLETFFL